MELRTWQNPVVMEGCSRGSRKRLSTIFARPFASIDFQKFQMVFKTCFQRLHARVVLALSPISALLTLTACAGRDAHPIAAINVTHSQFNCAGINREFTVNERSVIAIGKEKAGANADNIALSVTGASVSFQRCFSWTSNRRNGSRSKHCATAISH